MKLAPLLHLANLHSNAQLHTFVYCCYGDCCCCGYSSGYCDCHGNHHRCCCQLHDALSAAAAAAVAADAQLQVRASSIATSPGRRHLVRAPAAAC